MPFRILGHDMASDSTLIDSDGQLDDAGRPDDTIENPVHGEAVTFLKRARDTD